MEFKFECSSMKTSERWSGRTPQGMDLEIAHQPLMRHVVNLVNVMDQFKDSQSETVLSSEFRDEDLLNILLESAADEELMFEMTEAGPPSGFSQVVHQQCTLTDAQKRNLVRVQDTMELCAIRLQGGSTDHEVIWNMSTYVDPVPSSEAQPITLGIVGTQLYLSCSKKEDRPTLNLEEVQNVQELRRIPKESDMTRFLFYKSDTGVSGSSLMSTLYSSWYISTAPEDGLPVDMCQQSDSRYQTFTIRLN